VGVESQREDSFIVVCFELLESLDVWGLLGIVEHEDVSFGVSSY
jgi:hypothetical protein